MERGLVVEIRWFDELASTQTYLIEGLKSKVLKSPICIGASLQTQGRGSRGNEWIGVQGNLFISIAVNRSALPKDLKLESSSIYFAFIMKDLLSSLGSKVWLKWPNDFYFSEKKIGGVITNLVGETLVCGIGLNLLNAPEEFEKIDINTTPYNLTNYYITALEDFPSWKQIFSKYELEFSRSKSFTTNVNETVFGLKDAVLLEDGSLECNGQRIFSLR
jgi:BirA family biotin operon repressor/biotin-[acetyl-CoA-carboxylase] ligase